MVGGGTRLERYVQRNREVWAGSRYKKASESAMCSESKRPDFVAHRNFSWVPPRELSKKVPRRSSLRLPCAMKWRSLSYM
jgi:hypothetical protein